MDSETSSPSSSSSFPTTRWTLIFDLQDGPPQAKEKALDALCQQYWLPIYAYVKRKAGTSADAEDLTQGFFEKIIAGDLLERAEEGRGKLRSFLLACLENYMHGEWYKGKAQKRGGNVTVLNIDAENADQLLAGYDSQDLSPASAFDQAWAIALIQTIHEQLAAEYAARGKADDFEVMRDYLAWNERKRSYAEGCEALGVTEAALKQSVRRMRQRFGKLLRKQLAYTTETEAQVEEEIRSLFAAFR